MPVALRQEGFVQQGPDFSAFEPAFQEMQAQKQKSQGPAVQSPPAGGPPASTQRSESQKELEQEITSLTERMNALERVLVGTEERPGLAGLIGGWTRHNGFFLM